MGTHPIFESDFDCLTETKQMSFSESVLPLEEEELTLPIAAVNKLIKEAVPKYRVSKEARELVVSCCTQFIHTVATTSSETCNQASKKTIAPEHVLAALEQLGFPEMISECQEVLNECKATAAKRRKGSNRLEASGFTEEELFEQQQRLIAEAKQAQFLEEQQEYNQIQFTSDHIKSTADDDDDEDFDS